MLARMPWDFLVDERVITNCVGREWLGCLSQDNVQAYFWDSLALTNPAIDSETLGMVRSNRDVLVAKMTLTQFAVAQKAVHEWRSKPK